MVRGSLLTLTALVLAVPGTAQTPAAGTREQVEVALRSLQPAVQVQGRTYRNQTLLELMRRNEVPAVSIALLRGGKIAWARAYGVADVATGRAAGVDTMFQAASLSKPIAATAALKLVERGRLSLDEPVNARLKSWRIPNSQAGSADAVTLRHLLTHTAGLTPQGYGGYPAGSALPTLRQVLDGTPPANSEATRLTAAPGADWRYSGGGFTVAQQLMMDVSGQAFPQMMNRLVLRPAGMANSSFAQPLPARLLRQAAKGYLGTGKPVAGSYHLYPEMAAAGLWTTPTDMARWAAALSAAYNGQPGGILSPAMARQMLTPGKGDWGLGLGVRNDGEAVRFSHSGVNEGFRTMMIVDPRRGDGFVIMANGDGAGNMLSPLVQAFGGVLGWPEAKPRVLVPATITTEERDSILGRYEGNSIAVDIALKDGQIFATQNGSQTFELIPRGKGVFVAPDVGLRIEFIRDANGRVTELRSSGATLKRTR